MEKALFPNETPSKRSHGRASLPRLIVILAATTLSFYLWGDIQHFFESANSKADNIVRPSSDVFDWDSITAKPYLEYSNCYEEYQCARLELPMDYWNGTTNATISLAVIRRPAVVPITHPQYGGVVITNPGGPGGRGVDFLRGTGLQLSNTLDSHDTDGKFFDLISFDPRGVGQTKPVVACFQNECLSRSWNVRVWEEGLFDSSDASLGRNWAMSQAKRQSCAMPLPDGKTDVKKYVTTAYVARDMLEIVEKHGEWREREAGRLWTISNPVHHGTCGRLNKELLHIPEVLKYKPGKEKIQYWGFSYGTYLGSTFAAMFPTRIQRIVLDGVVEAWNYKSALWSNNVADTEKTMDSFYYHCAQAGYPSCPLANKTGETNAIDVKQQSMKIIESLYHNPLPVIGPNPEVITYSDARMMIFFSLYSPMTGFPLIARMLSNIAQRNGTELVKILRADKSVNCNNEDQRSPLSDDAEMAIACSDGDDQSFVNRTMFEKFSKELSDISPTIGAIWSGIRMHCIHYNKRPVYRFVGPWLAKTSHPLLLIGNTADPVTPLINAHAMAKGFDGAVTLAQDSAGHCSTSAYSNCTVAYIKRYFQTGELPPLNTTCAVDEVPFELPQNLSLSAHDTGIYEARGRHADIGNALLKHGGGFMRGVADRQFL